MVNELLLVDELTGLLQDAVGPPGQFAIGDALHAASLRTENGLEDNVAAEAIERIKCIVGALRHVRGRRRQPRGREPHVGEVLIDARLHRARRIQQRQSPRGRGVQHIHPKDDLFEGACGNGAHDGGVVTVERSGTRFHAGRERAKVDDLRVTPVFPRGPEQVLDVPTVAAGENRKSHAHSWVCHSLCFLQQLINAAPRLSQSGRAGAA